MNDVLRRICEIPDDFHGYTRPGRDLSFRDLVRASGYLEAPHKVTVQALAEFLGAHMEYIAHWLQWSEDRRSPGPYFARCNEAYEVGTLKDSGEKSKGTLFADPATACARFILAEIYAFPNL